MTKSLPMLRQGMKNRFEPEAEALRQAIKEIGVEVFAAHLGNKSVGTIRSEMVPTKSPDSPHKTGFDDALSAIYLSGDISALVKFLDRLDYIVVPREETKMTISRENLACQLMAGCGMSTAHLAEALADGIITEEEWEMVAPGLKALEMSLAAVNHNKW